MKEPIVQEQENVDRALECLVFLINSLSGRVVDNARKKERTKKKGEAEDRTVEYKPGSHNPHFHLTVRPGSKATIKWPIICSTTAHTHDPSFFLYNREMLSANINLFSLIFRT